MELRDKKVALVGLGLENQAMLPHLLKRGAVVTVCDKNPNFPAKPENASFQIGENYLDNLSEFDVIFRSPGVAYLTPELQRAKEAGVLLTSQTKYFFENTRAKVIGITGTKGKGTTASLIFAALKKAKENGEITAEVFLAGNIGVPAVEVLDKASDQDWVILELSSFQLQDLDSSPHVAVVLGVNSDHLDYHKSQQEYEDSKRNIVSHQRKEDFAVLSADNPVAREMARATQASVYFYSERDEVRQGVFISKPDTDQAAIVKKLAGQRSVLGTLKEISENKNIRHWEDVLAAVLASLLVGAGWESIKQSLAEFAGLPHRLELVAIKNGVEYYDDSAATTPAATMAALSQFVSPITLILGGSSKGADFSPLLEEIKIRPVANILCIGEEGGRLAEKFAAGGWEINVMRVQGSMSEIVRQAALITKPGGVVLLSPAAASFDMFKNAADRGEQFKSAVRLLPDEFDVNQA